MATRQPRKLAQARAYWRLAAKAYRAGKSRDVERYNRIADARYREYLREQARIERNKIK